MSRVNCNVKSCVHNRFHSCLRAEIQIEDMGKDETICKAYKERETTSSDMELADMDYPQYLKVKVNCKKDDCKYQYCNGCDADRITICDNYQNGHITTKCATYKK